MIRRLGSKKILMACLGLMFSSLAQAVDIQIAQLTDNPDPAIRAGEITYSVSILNNSNDTADNVVLSMPVPVSTSFVSVNDARCSHDGGSPGTVTCTLGSITGDGFGNPVINVDMTIRSSVSTGGAIAFTATGSTSSFDSNIANDSLTQNTTINDGADLSTTVTDNADPATAGGNLSYSIVTQNQGPNDAVNVTVVDTLPAEMTFISAGGSGWSCSAAGQNVTCTRTNIAAGTSAPSINVVGKITGNINGTMTNVVNVSALTGDPDPNNNTTTEDTQVNIGADLELTKSASSPVVGLGTVTFTLQARNLGPFQASSVVVSDTLPANIVYVNATGSGWNCSHSGESSGGTVTCTRTTYNVGATDDITITATAPATGGFSNTATISSATADAVIGNNSGSSVSTVIPDGADLSLTKTKTPNPVAQGEDINSILRVRNLGPLATSGVITLTDNLAPGETYVGFSGSNWNCSHNGVNPGGTVTCTYGNNLAPNTNANNLTIVTNATNPGNLTNNATVADVGGLGDAVPGNNGASASVVATAAIADLSILKALSTANADNVLQDTENTLTYTLTVTNNGPNAITDAADGIIDDAVVVTDLIPNFVSAVVGALPRATVVNVSDDSGGKFVCTTGTVVSCRLGDGQTMANAETVIFTITASRPMANGAFTNTATVSSSVLGDDDGSNNSADASGSVDPVADVEMQEISVTPASVVAGTEATFVVTFRNNGPSNAANVVVTNDFTPPGGRSFTLISATSTQGTCGTLVGNQVTCNISGTLGRNDTETVTLVVRPDWDPLNTPWVLPVSSTITTSTADSNPANANRSASLDVEPARLDLLVNKTDVTDPVGYTATPIAFPGSLDNIIVYRVDVTNSGPSLASSVVLTDTMTPKNGKQLTFLCDGNTSASCTVPASTCSNTGVSVVGPASLPLTCNLQDMDPSSITTRYLFFRVDSPPDSSGDTHYNTAAISSNEDDTLMANNTEDETTSVRVRVDLAVTKTPSIPEVDLFQPFTWNMVVSNNGPGSSDDSNLIDNLPSGMELTGAPVPAQGTCTGAATDTVFTCALGTIPNGGSVNVSAPVRVISYPSGGTITNTARVTTFGVDQVPSNDTDDGTVTVRRSSIAGTVFNDINNNGIQNASDTGIASVQLTLTGTDAYGNAVSRLVTTDASGAYLVDNLPASDANGYTLAETQPVGFTDGFDSRAGVLIPGSQTSDTIASIAVPVNTALTNYNFAELGRAALSGLVWLDENNDGIKDPAETLLIGGVQINLTGTETDSGNTISVTATTAADGTYQFFDLRAGIYALTQIQPAAWGSGLSVPGTAGGAAITNLISNIVLSGATIGTDYNFAEVGAVVSGFVYQDIDNSATLDAGEPGLRNVTVTLSGTDIFGSAVNQVATTDSNGAFRFTQLPAANPAGYVLQETQPVVYSDGQDTLGALGGTPGNDVFSAIPVTGGSLATDYLFGESALLTSILSGTVFSDSNDDGIQDAGESGIENVTLTLTGTDFDGNPVSETVTTNAQGEYQFNNIAPSDASGYTITETQPGDYFDGLENSDGTLVANSRSADVISNLVIVHNIHLANQNFAEIPAASLSGTVWHDDNNNGVIDAVETQGIGNVTIRLTGTDNQGNPVDRTETTAADGRYQFDLIAPGTYNLTEIQPAAWADGSEQLGNQGGTAGNDTFTSITLGVGSAGTGYNFGEQGNSLSGYVYVDGNDNGQMEAHEVGIKDVTLTLTGTDLEGNAINRTVVSLVQGDFRFAGLPFPDSDGYSISEVQPAGFSDGRDTAGDQGGTVGNDLISTVRITAGPGTNVNPVTATGYLFGESLANPASISGTAWLDLNHNRADDDNGGQPDWIVELLANRVNPLDEGAAKVLATTVTDSNGEYVFDDVPPGTYEIRFRHPEGKYLYGIPLSTEASVDVASGTIHNLVLPAGYQAQDQDLPIDPSGIVYNALTREAVAGAEVTLTGPPGFDAVTDLVGGISNLTQLTSDDGLYQFLLFNTAPAGVYSLSVSSPEGYLPGVATSIPVCVNTPSVLASANPVLVHENPTPPALSAPAHDAQNCPATSDQFTTGEQSTQYFLSFNIDPTLPSANIVNNHIPLDPIIEGSVTVVKTAAKANVVIGDLVPYTIQATNNLTVTLNNLNVIDQLPPGFKYVQGSGQLNGVAQEPVVTGNHIQWQNQTLTAGSTNVYQLLAVVGAGVAEGEYVNQAWVNSSLTDISISNVGKATVRVTPDPLFDCSDVIGSVFEDHNINGYQDDGETGLAGVRLATARGLLVTTDKQGRYHITCADVPNNMRGSNFIVKLDKRSLPSGYRVTSENPRVVRLTRGKVVKANFGAVIHRVISVDLDSGAFDDQHQLQADYLQQLQQVIEQLDDRPSVLRIAYDADNESSSDIDQQLDHVKTEIDKIWQDCDCRYELIIETEVRRPITNESNSQTRRAGHE